MTYEVQDKVKELAEITGTTPEATAGSPLASMV